MIFFANLDIQYRGKNDKGWQNLKPAAKVEYRRSFAAQKCLVFFFLSIFVSTVVHFDTVTYVRHQMRCIRATIKIATYSGEGADSSASREEILRVGPGTSKLFGLIEKRLNNYPSVYISVSVVGLHGGGISGYRKSGEVLIYQIRRRLKSGRRSELDSTVCPRSSYPFYLVTYYIEWLTTSWTDGKLTGYPVQSRVYSCAVFGESKKKNLPMKKSVFCA